MNNNHHFKSNTLAVIQMTGFSLLGIVLFFVPITIGGKRTIAFDHMAGYLVNEQRTLAVILLFLLMIYGVAKPFVSGTWRSNATNMIVTPKNIDESVENIARVIASALNSFIASMHI